MPSDVRQVFLTAHDIRQVTNRYAAAFQRHVDNAVSKTINLSASATWADVRHIFIHAHRRGCKGITVYREGSRPDQVLTSTRNRRCCPVCGRFVHSEEGAMQCDTCG